MVVSVARRDDPKENPEGVNRSGSDCGLLAAQEVHPGAPRGSVMTGIAARSLSSCFAGLPTIQNRGNAPSYGVITLHST